jgi:hypothetical protein
MTLMLYLLLVFGEVFGVIISLTVGTTNSAKNVEGIPLTNPRFFSARR